MKVVADISTESGQVDWSAPVLKAQQSNADAVFVYTNEKSPPVRAAQIAQAGLVQADRR